MEDNPRSHVIKSVNQSVRSWQGGNAMRSIRYSLNITITILLLASLIPPTPTAGQGQDLTFRLMNIERRLDQMQARVDFLERVQQSPTINQSSNMTTTAVLDLQRQQLSIAEQILTM